MDLLVKRILRDLGGNDRGNELEEAYESLKKARRGFNNNNNV